MNSAVAELVDVEHRIEVLCEISAESECPLLTCAIGALVARRDKLRDLIALEEAYNAA